MNTFCHLCTGRIIKTFWNRLHNKSLVWKDIDLSQLSKYILLQLMFNALYQWLILLSLNNNEIKATLEIKWKKKALSSCAFLAAITIRTSISRNDVTQCAAKSGKHCVICINSADFQTSSSVAKHLEPFSCQPTVMETHSSLSSQPLLQDAGLGLICRQHFSSGICVSRIGGSVETTNTERRRLQAQI